MNSSRVLLCAFLLLLHVSSSSPPTSLLLLPLVRSGWGWLHDVTCGNCRTILRELSTKPPLHPLRAQKLQQEPLAPSLTRKTPIRTVFALYHVHEKRRASQATTSTKCHEHACETQHERACERGGEGGIFERMFDGGKIIGGPLKTSCWGNGGMTESNRGIEQNDGVKE